LITPSGSIAVWWPRDPQANLFLEGDVVGVNSQGLLDANTTNAELVGVVASKRGIIGRFPEESEATGNFIIQQGFARVKVAGPIHGGQWLIPSGRNDLCATVLANRQPQDFHRIAMVQANEIEEPQSSVLVRLIQAYCFFLPAFHQ